MDNMKAKMFGLDWLASKYSKLARKSERVPQGQTFFLC